MKIVFHKLFSKRYSKLIPKLKNKVDNAIIRFQTDPLDSSLCNHALSGSMHGKRAISVTGNVRIIFEEHDDYALVLMLDVGTHPQVYKS